MYLKLWKSICKVFILSMFLWCFFNVGVYCYGVFEYNYLSFYVDEAAVIDLVDDGSTDDDIDQSQAFDISHAIKVNSSLHFGLGLTQYLFKTNHCYLIKPH